MPYVNSSLDNKNLKWFGKVNDCQSLVSLKLSKGKMRGLTDFSVDFSYPITAIAGANGSGKSTILALVACAFHNKKKGYRLPGRKVPYYTFSDFFIQSAGETSPEGVEIWYQIRHDQWSNSDAGIGKQARRKPLGGKWSNYSRRVNRNVLYFGVQRVVPYFERAVHKSNRSRFKSGEMEQTVRDRIASLAGKILGKTYSEFESHEYSKYWLPKVKTGNLSYSGFNMGAGESAVLEILSALFSAGKGCLLVIDEIELGLHEHAQKRLIEVLKDLCNELRCQIICTTHSYQILNSLPQTGRMYIETVGGKTKILSEISAEYACGKMGRNSSHELDIFVEDEVAQTIVQASLDLDLRGRCQIIEIGSCGSIKRAMAARYMENRRNCLGLLDGDQRSSKISSLSEIANMCDGKFATKSDEIQGWAEGHLSYMPGSEWPEKWVFGLALQSLDLWKSSLAATWAVPDEDSIKDFLDQAIAAGKHKEFHTLAKSLSLPEKTVRWDLIMELRKCVPAEFDDLANSIQKIIK